MAEQAQGQGDVAQVEEPEWEIIKILDKRQTLSGIEYMVRWKITWLPTARTNQKSYLTESTDLTNQQHSVQNSLFLHPQSIRGRPQY